MRYWTALGGSKKIRRLWEEESVLTPLCQSRGIIETSNLVTSEKVVVLKSAGSRYTMEVVDFTKDNLLPTFSFIFIEFESEGFLFHTTW